MIRIRVRAFPRDGYFRAHRYWPGEWVDDEVDETTLAILQAERNLAVEIVGRTADEDDAEAPRRPPSPPAKPKSEPAK